MKVFPSERERQASDTRTVSWFFLVMFVLVIAYGLAVAAHYMLGWW
ncbi:MAG TPA: hypothetical protein VJN96_03220 [Vicinamibacterales bacterium]|nr:hypothetical protein [Vicinamibacterales bacterium]